MSFDELNQRERDILRVLIDHYVATAEPVGSRILANKYPLGVSPATIRNTMQDLEEMGLIRQPHTSAGRVPTDEGYRLYVHKLIEHQEVSAPLAKRLREKLEVKHQRAVDDILEQTAHVLASVTSQIGVTLAPQFEKGVISRIELVRVAERRMLVVLGIHSGLARTVLLEVSADIDDSSIRETESVLNERLSGQSLHEVHASLTERLQGVMRGDARLVKLFVDAADELVERAPGEGLHVDGTSNLFSQPEFSDHHAMGGVLRVIEKRVPIIEMLKARGMGEGLLVTIGQEVQLEGTQGCSLVTSNYRVGQIEGTIGILGPTRMEYAKVVSIVEYMAKLLSEQMEG